MLGDPSWKISMMVATDAIHWSIFDVVARRKGGQGDYVSFQNYIDRLGLVRAGLKGDQEPSALDVANTLIKRCQSTNLMTATPKGSKGSLERGERAKLTIQGQLRAFREAVSMKYKTDTGPDHVLMGWMVRYCAWVVNNFQVKGRERLRFVGGLLGRISLPKKTHRRFQDRLTARDSRRDPFVILSSLSPFQQMCHLIPWLSRQTALDTHHTILAQNFTIWSQATYQFDLLVFTLCLRWPGVVDKVSH